MRSDRETVWNRAALDRGGDDPAPGDVALAALLSVHSLAMNGGVVHSVEAHSAEQLSQALAGFRYFGLADAASAVQWAIDRVQQVDLDGDLDETEKIEVESDRRYGEAVPEEDTLYEAFVSVIVASPDAFAST